MLDYKCYIGLGILSFLIISLVLRGKRGYRIPVWSIMALAAFITVMSGLVGLEEMGSVIDVDVVLFLIGMFSLVGLAEASGLLNMVSVWFISRFKSSYSLVLASSMLFGFLAAFAMNDTVALMGPPIAYTISKIIKASPTMMFLLLAFSITIGSVMTPIGNPQNVLVAENSGIQAPFVTFVLKLSVPTFLNLIITPLILLRIFKVRNIKIEVGLIPQETIRDKRDALLAAIGLTASVVVLVINDLFELSGLPHVTKRGFIPFIIAAGTYAFSRNPRKLISNVDWGTIIFFIAMFITTEGIWRSGILTPLEFIMSSKQEGIMAYLTIATVSIPMSQLISNVPFTKLFIMHMQNLGYTGADVDAWLALAAFSTIAGNLTILGAASNIIILEALESRMNATISFFEFLKAGLPATLVNVVTYLAFFTVF
ncbi:MAG: SLC13 family permease [Nitrososphaerota archaeon]|nr:SLC13 family permease [Aigarchaeota archaeon]MDW8076716.1 SLC13 family permease [Nitrososphaerota archaeon]